MVQRSEQLRREAEQTRAQLAGTLEELRARITPGQVVDQLVDYAGDSDAGEFFRNLGRQAAKNPIPVTLMGAGLAWLMLAGKSGPSTDRIAQRGRDLASGTADTLGRWGSAARGTASGWRATGSRMPDETSAHRRDASSRVSQAADEAGSAAAEVGENAAAGYGDIREQARSAYGAATEKAAAAYGAVSDKAGSAYEAMSDKAAAAYEDASAAAARAAAAAQDRTQAMRQSAADASRSILDFCKEQPLISAGLGLALGAAIGAALPSTRKENELMGEASDRLKEHAQALAEEQYEKTRAAAEHAYEEARQEVEKQTSVLVSELAEATHESLTTAPALPGEAASSEGESASEPRHGRR